MKRMQFIEQATIFSNIPGDTKVSFVRKQVNIMPVSQYNLSQGDLDLRKIIKLTKTFQRWLQILSLGHTMRNK